jgi:hypothetical protein
MERKNSEMAMEAGTAERPRIKDQRPIRMLFKCPPFESKYHRSREIEVSQV